MNETIVPSVYLDANILIYLVEGYAAHETALEQLLAALERKQVKFVTSELSLAEVLVLPLRQGRADLVERYQQLMAPGGELVVVTIDAAILQASAVVRARKGGGLLDAIHVATAVAAGCSIFLSEDVRIKVVAPLQFFGLSDFVGHFAP
jgi:predicted nucleic acid-binding protein